MGCMKCGRETAPEQIFCDACLEQMGRYPVPPGTAVHIPQRRENTSQRRGGKKRSLSPEEQVRRLKAQLRAITILWLITLALAGVLAYPAAKHLFDERLPTGQNYSFINSNTEPDSDVSRETSGNTP